MAVRYERVAHSAVERLQAALNKNKVKPRDLAIVSAVATDKALLLRGEATARIEVRQGQPTIESVNRQLKELMDELEEADAKALEPKQRPITEAEVIQQLPGAGPVPPDHPNGQGHA